MAKNIRSAYARARAVDPRPITGKESAEDLLQHAFGAYVGRQERTAYELMCRSVDEGASVFLTLSGAMTPAGLHQSCLIPLIELGFAYGSIDQAARFCLCAQVGISEQFTDGLFRTFIIALPEGIVRCAFERGAYARLGRRRRRGFDGGWLSTYRDC